VAIYLSRVGAVGSVVAAALTVSTVVMPPGRINVFYNESSGGKYVPRAALFDLEPGVVDAARASLLGEVIRPGNLLNENAGAGKNRASQGSRVDRNSALYLPRLTAARQGSQVKSS
jgi:hypothetical protein